MTDLRPVYLRSVNAANAYRSVACMVEREGNPKQARFWRSLARSTLRDARMLRETMQELAA